MQIITARRIISLGDDNPAAFACRGEWIVASGDLAGLRKDFPDARVVDFGDATIVPGFNDAHQHPTICAEQSLQVPLSPQHIGSTADLVAALHERAARTRPGDWVVGSGYDHFRSNAGEELTRADLDDEFPDHPVLVVHVTLHAGVVNTRGLELACLTDDSSPPSGGELGRDPAGRLTGVLHDQALYDLAFPAFTRSPTVVPQPGTTELLAALEDYAGNLHAAGITSVGDALVGPEGWKLLRQADEQGRLTLRVNALAAYEHFDYFRALPEEPTRATDRLRLGGIKAFADGAVNGGTCLVEQPIEGTDRHGIARVSAAELTEIVRDVHDAGWRACVHANGDRAIRRMLDAVDSAQSARPRADVRH
ncbi:MAG: amidohydrolase, partial [Haloechinothrix sp.]